MKKYLVILTFLLAFCCLVSCTDDEAFDVPVTEALVVSGNNGVFTDFEDFYMTLNSVGSSAIGVTWHNDTELEMIFGEGYFVEIMTSDGEWESVQNAEMSVPAIALMLPAGGTLEKGYSLKPFDLSRVGRYRLRSEFHYGGETYSTWVEFSVIEGSAANINRIPDTDLSEFAAFLDREGFVKGMRQGTLLDLAERYSEGLDPAIVPVFCHYDGEFGGGCSASGELFGYTNDYRAKDGKVTYTNSFYAAVEIKSLALPYGIKYGDSIATVLEKLGIDREIYKNTSAYEDTKLALYDDGTASLILFNHFLTTAPVDFLYDYELVYTEKIDTLTRTVTLSFSDSEKDLARIEIKTVDNYESKE